MTKLAYIAALPLALCAFSGVASAAVNFDKHEGIQASPAKNFIIFKKRVFFAAPTAADQGKDAGRRQRNTDAGEAIGPIKDARGFIIFKKRIF